MAQFDKTGKHSLTKDGRCNYYAAAKVFIINPVIKSSSAIRAAHNRVSSNSTADYMKVLREYQLHS